MNPQVTLDVLAVFEGLVTQGARVPGILGGNDNISSEGTKPTCLCRRYRYLTFHSGSTISVLGKLILKQKANKLSTFSVT